MHRKTESGFTLLEIVTVSAVLGLIAVISMPFYTRLQRFAILSSSREEVYQGIRLAQVSAREGLRNNNFGVLFQAHSYILYEGASFSARVAGSERTFSLPTTVTVAGMSEVNFEKGTGIPSPTGTITLIPISSGINETITINQLGPIY